MNFAFSEEQEELRRTVRQFLEAKSPETEVRRLMETPEGYDPSVWKQMGQELGPEIRVPGERGQQDHRRQSIRRIGRSLSRPIVASSP